MAPPRRNRNKKKKKTVLYRGMPPGFTPGTGYVTPVDQDERKGKALVEENSSDEAPEEYVSYSGCSKKGGPCSKRINTLKKPNLPPMAIWTSDDYVKHDSFLIKKWEISGWCDKDSVYVGARDFNSKVAFTARTFYKFKRVIHGRTISELSKNAPAPLP